MKNLSTEQKLNRLVELFSGPIGENERNAAMRLLQSAKDEEELRYIILVFCCQYLHTAPRMLQ